MDYLTLIRESGDLQLNLTPHLPPVPGYTEQFPIGLKKKQLTFQRGTTSLKACQLILGLVWGEAPPRPEGSLFLGFSSGEIVDVNESLKTWLGFVHSILDWAEVYFERAAAEAAAELRKSMRAYLDKLLEDYGHTTSYDHAMCPDEPIATKVEHLASIFTEGGYDPESSATLVDNALTVLRSALTGTALQLKPGHGQSADEWLEHIRSRTLFFDVVRGSDLAPSLLEEPYEVNLGRMFVTVAGHADWAAFIGALTVFAIEGGLTPSVAS